MVDALDIARRIQALPLFARQIPTGWQLSVPLPDRSLEQPVWRCFLYPRAVIRGPRDVGRPTARLSTSWDGSRLVEFALVSERPFSVEGPDPVGRYPHDAIADWEPRRLIEAKKAMYTAVGQLADQAWAEEPSAAALAILDEARQTLLEPGLLPYYDEVAAPFWGWLGVTRG